MTSEEKQELAELIQKIVAYEIDKHFKTPEDVIKDYEAEVDRWLKIQEETHKAQAALNTLKANLGLDKKDT